MAIESQGTLLQIAGSAGGAVTITDMTLSYPTILTSAGHALTDGDVVTLANFAGADAATLNSIVTVVTNVTTDTFAVQIDTTGKTIDDNTNAATATPKAWTDIGEVADISREDPGASEIDVTHLKSTAREYLEGLQNFGSYNMTVNFLFTDTGQLALRAAQVSRAVQSFKVTYSDASTMTFSGFVMAFSGPNASVDDKLVGDVTIKVTGSITYGP